MRSYACLIALIAAAAPAQQRQSVTSVRDINGRVIEWSQSSAGDGRSTQTTQNLSGRRVPVEQVQEKILKNEGGVRVVERLIKRYDASGVPLPAEKAIVETTTRADGSTTEKATLWRADLNGTLRPAERLFTESSKSGDTTTSQVTVERTSVNGSFETQERRAIRETVTKTTSERDETVARRDTNGQFVDSARTVTRTSTVNDVTQTQTDEYDATTGQLKLFRQSSGRTVKNPDGTERQEIDIFGPAAPGRAVSADGQLQLRERQIFTSRQSPDGSTVQVFAIQRPSLTSAKELGPAQTISETVITGK